MPFMTLAKLLAFTVAIPIKAFFKVHALSKEVKLSLGKTFPTLVQLISD